ncbi:hypothetical protein C8A01DRAFT_47505 [Parachaetomium inaequale]|uniref:Survival Motor Neuron Gemin2-binding domain-containing protein n=1 Tax=Parachaetomium inaequale TaxID=2588326 RepID=A0AAN6SQZ9_9PEZI|nr:hypothetical protein C8A01DRAFT_47505 [Parachaetomium inaequale]
MDSETAATHEEIWDDSALIDSWNQALDEYKKYHSIHAKGGTVDDIPNGADQVTRSSANAKPETGEGDEPIAAGEGAEDEGEIDETMPMDESDETSHPPISDVQGSVDAKKGAGVLAGGPPVAPMALLGSVQDEELKKLLMSWYYAGYYTGLYEGKQQGSQQPK